MQEKKSPPPEKQALNQYLKYSSMAFQMIGIIGVFTFIGYKIDESYNNKSQIITGIASLLGVIVSLYLILRSLKST